MYHKNPIHLFSNYLFLQQIIVYLTYASYNLYNYSFVYFYLKNWIASDKVEFMKL